jgi:glycosyltransferase involved in cell wall biosynthesis
MWLNVSWRFIGKSSLNMHDHVILIIGPSVRLINGSVLRAYNIWDSLRGLRSASIIYLPIRFPLDVLLNLRLISKADIIIISGVPPWISALTSSIARLLNKTVIADVHGSPYYEETLSGRAGLTYRALLYVTEYLTYRLSNYLILASKTLGLVLSRYFRINLENAYIINNAITRLFIKIADSLMGIRKDLVWETLVKPILGRDKICNLLLAPLPSVFVSNLLAYERLRQMIRTVLDRENAIVVVTGLRNKVPHEDSIVSVGYIPFINYVALVLNSRALLLPYPNNAVCGGIRNKVLEAGYCGIPMISTRAGMLHSDAMEWIHYIPLNEAEPGELKDVLNSGITEVVRENMRELVKRKYLPGHFKAGILGVLLSIIRRSRVR